MMGPLSLTIEKIITAGNIDFAPNRARGSRVWRDRTTPGAAPARATKGNDFDPIASIWRTSSRPSQRLSIALGDRSCRRQIPRQESGRGSRKSAFDVKSPADGGPNYQLSTNLIVRHHDSVSIQNFLPCEHTTTWSVIFLCEGSCCDY